MGQVNVHERLVETVKAGMAIEGLNQMQLSCLSGVGQGNLSAILRGKPCSEATWQKLMDVVWP